MHFADVHFGVENYGRFDPASGLPSRLVDFRDALNAAIDIALGAGIELAVFAGDAYKTRDPNQTHQREFAQCLSRLAQENIPIVMLAGNHDIPNMKGRANAIEIFGALMAGRLRVFDTPGLDVVQTKNGHTVQIAAMPYLIKSLVLSRDEYKDRGVQETTALIVDKYVGGINALAAKCDPDLPTILMGHFSVTNAKLSAGQVGYLTNEPEVPLSALTQAPFDYVRPGGISTVFRTCIAASSPRSFTAAAWSASTSGSAKKKKVSPLVELLKGDTEVRHITIPTRPFVEIETDARPAGDQVTEHVLQALAGHDLRNAVVKLSYKINSEQLAALREAEIRAALAPAFMVVTLHKDIARDTDAVRSKVLTEALDPLQALATYCDTRETLKARKADLLAAAQPLLHELEQDEALN